MSTGFEIVKLALDELHPSPGFADWLAREQLSIAITKGNSLGFVGLAPDGSVSYEDEPFGFCLGLHSSDSDTVFVASRYQIWRLENALPPERTDAGGRDRLFLPQTAWTTGMLGIRDLAVTPDGDVVFVNGLFSCLSAPSSTLNFEPLWLPPFISALEPEERCHMTGVALADGRPAFVTCAAATDQPNGWRERQRDGGVVVSVPDGEVIAGGLSMPYSPVLRDSRLWLCAGGAGELSVIDAGTGNARPVAALPGFTRGLALKGGSAVVATSQPHRGETFEGLPLADRLGASGARGQCGIFVVELESGRIEHSLLFHGGASEIHALALLPGVRAANAVRFSGDQAQELVTFPSP
jgi:uncharacterized protein (TIGR03032 family)